MFYNAANKFYCRPEASISRRQHHAREAAHPRCSIRYCNPSPRKGRAGCSGAYGLTPPHHPQPPQEKSQPSLCSFLESIAVVLAAAACYSIVTTRACCHRLPIFLPNHHHAASLLFSSGSAAGIDFGILLPVPFSTQAQANIDALRSTTVRRSFFCYRQQQQ